LQAAIAARVHDYPFTGPMVLYLWKRVNTVKNRFLALAALIAAGKIPRERAAIPRPGRTREPTGADGINWRKWLPMKTFAWLCWLMQSRADRFGAAQFAEGLRHLLGQPGMIALLAATPKVGRVLAPLCFMLGIEKSLLRPRSCPAPTTPDIAAPERLAVEPDAAVSHVARVSLAREDTSTPAPHAAPDFGPHIFVSA
jgi:hypothetical protein